MRLLGKVSASVSVVLEVTQGSVLGLLLFILYISELFYIVGKHIVGYADETKIYAVLSRPPSHPHVMESLKQDLTAINFWCLKRHMRLNPKKMKSILVSRSRTIALSYGDLTLVSAELV